MCDAKGWFVFCPIYLAEGWDTGKDFVMVPRFRLWWLFELALFFQEGVNWIISTTNPDACGYTCKLTKKYDKPFEVR